MMAYHCTVSDETAAATPHVGEVIDGHLAISQPESATSLRNRMSTAEDVDAA
jgi:hypothetical protein